MINKVTYQQEPDLFDDIAEFSIDTIKDHRKGKTFFRQDIIEFTDEDRKFFPTIDNFSDYIGTWVTDTIIWDADNGFDGETYSELVRVEKKEKISYEWVNIK